MMLNDFKCLEVVGKGGFGTVMRVQKKTGEDANKIYALKEVRLKSMKGSAELRILRSVKHPLLVELIGSFEQKKKFYFMFPYLSGGSLDTYLSKVKILEESTASFCMKEIVLALEYLHCKRIIHRDVKPDNILLDAMGHIRLTDFGLSLDHFSPHEKCFDYCGTLNYMAPEILLKTGYGFSADWYAVGVIFYRMVAGMCPFDDQRDKVLTRKIINGTYTLPKNLTSSAKSLIQNLLKWNPEERLGYTGAKAIKKHKFFKHTRWDKVFLQLESPLCVYKNNYFYIFYLFFVIIIMSIIYYIFRFGKLPFK